MIYTYEEMNNWLSKDSQRVQKLIKCVERIYKSKLVLIEDDDNKVLITAFVTAKRK